MRDKHWPTVYGPNPCIVVRVAAGIYPHILVRRQISTEELRAEIRSVAIRHEVSCCLMLKWRLCIYFEPDGTSYASTKRPFDGFHMDLTDEDWLRLLKKGTIDALFD